MLTLGDLVEVTGINTDAEFDALNKNCHGTDPLSWLCYLDYVAIGFHFMEFVDGPFLKYYREAAGSKDYTFGVRFQFDCVGSRKCSGCLSNVWKLVKSFGNLISLGGLDRVNGLMLVSKLTVLLQWRFLIVSFLGRYQQAEMWWWLGCRCVPKTIQPLLQASSNDWNKYKAVLLIF